MTILGRGAAAYSLMLVASFPCIASQDEELAADTAEKTAEGSWGVPVFTLLVLLVGGYAYSNKPPAKANPFMNKTKKKGTKPRKGGTHDDAPEIKSGPGEGSDAQTQPQAHKDECGATPGTTSSDAPTTNSDKPSTDGGLNQAGQQLFARLDQCPTFTLVNKQGELAAGPDGKARFFIAFEEVMAQLTAISARGGVELLLHVVGLGRAVAMAAQGKGLIIGRKEDAELAASLPTREGEEPWTVESGLPLFYSPIMMLKTPDGKTVRPLFVDGADGRGALEKAKAQVAREKADVPATALELHVVPLQTILQLTMEGKVKHSVIQPPSRSLKAIAEITASANASAGADAADPSPPPPLVEGDGVISGAPPPELKEVD